MDHSALLPTAKPHYSHHIVRIALWVIGVAVVGYLVLTIGYMVGRWNGDVAQRVAHVIPTPIGWYRGQPIWQRDVLTMTTGMRTYLSGSKPTGATVATSTGDPKEIAMNTLLRTEATRRYLQDRGIKLLPEDVRQAFTAQISQYGSPNTVAERFQKLYHWTPAEYRTYITTADMLRAKMRAYLVGNETLSSAERKQAETVLGLIQSKQITFVEAAKKYSQDSYAPFSGDMGFVGRDEIDSVLENVAFRLPLNEVSEVVVSSYGYHILRVTEQRQATSGVEIHLWQIFIPGPDVDQIVTTELKQHHPWIWEAGLRWNAETARVERR